MMHAEAMSLADAEAIKLFGGKGGDKKSQSFDFKSLIGLIAKMFSGGQLAGLDVEAVKKLAHELYDKYVVPFDIPYIPESLEPTIDELLKSSLDAIIDKLFAKSTPAPDPQPV
jgi:hypothetical protein